MTLEGNGSAGCAGEMGIPGICAHGLERSFNNGGENKHSTVRLHVPEDDARHERSETSSELFKWCKEKGSRRGQPTAVHVDLAALARQLFS